MVTAKCKCIVWPVVTHISFVDFCSKTFHICYSANTVKAVNLYHLQNNNVCCKITHNIQHKMLPYNVLILQPAYLLHLQQSFNQNSAKIMPDVTE